MSQLSTTQPGWICPKPRLETLRERRRERRIMRHLFEGNWRYVLITLAKTSHRFRDVQSQSGAIAPLFTKVNLIRRAVEMHADIVANRAPTFSVGEGFEDQDETIDTIRKRCLFDALFHESVVRTFVESEAPLVAKLDNDSGGAVIDLGANDEWFPVGPARPDRQPSVWERRWCVERKGSGDNKRRFLRVERHRLEEGQHVIEQEAYTGKHVDTLSGLDELRRVPLAQAFEDPTMIPAERTLSGLTTLPVAQLVRYRQDGEPCPLLSMFDLDIVDSLAAGFSRIDRMFELHGNAKLRISEQMIDPKTGHLKSNIDELLVDPQKEIEYIVAEFKFEQMLSYLDRLSEWMLVAKLSISPSLIGMKLSGGATPDSFDKLRLEASNTLSAAERSKPYMSSALGRVMTAATEMESMLPLRGFAHEAVDAMIYPELPRDSQQRIRDMSEQRSLGAIDELTMLERIHGPDQAVTIQERLEEERQRVSERNRTELFGAIGGEGGVA